MAQTLYRAKTGSGTVTITDESVTVDIPGGQKTQMVRRANITGIEQKTVVMSVMGMGGAKQITIHTSGHDTLVLRVVKPKDAAQIMSLLR